MSLDPIAVDAEIENSEVVGTDSTLLTKDFYKSKTFWFLAIAAVLVIFDFGPGDFASKAEEVATMAALLGALFGRMNATKPMSVLGITAFSKD